MFSTTGGRAERISYVGSPNHKGATATHASRCCSGVDPIREDDSDHMYGQQVVKGNAIGGKEENCMKPMHAQVYCVKRKV